MQQSYQRVQIDLQERVTMQCCRTIDLNERLDEVQTDVFFLDLQQLVENDAAVRFVQIVFDVPQ